MRNTLWVLTPLAVLCFGCPQTSGTDGGNGTDSGSGNSDSGTPDSGTDAGPACDWPQFAHDSTHSSNTCAVAQPPNRVLATLVYDPFVPNEQWETYGGDLQAHYPSPLLVGDDVYMMNKSGQYVDCEPPLSGPYADGGYTGLLADGGPCGSFAWNSEVWTEKKFEWEDGVLMEQWMFWSDWKPVPAFLTTWEPPFQAAVVADTVLIPGAGGTVHQVDRDTGVQRALLNPFPVDGGINPNIYLTGGIAVDGQNNAYYNALLLDPNDVFNDATGYLVRIGADGTLSSATYQSLVPIAPAATDLCYGVFDTYQFDPDSGIDYPILLPPPDDGGNPVYPAQASCMSQRAGLNATPAVGPDGTIYIVSRAHDYEHYGFIAAVNPDLTPKWQVSMRDYLNDGCGVLIPADAFPDGGLPDGGYGFDHCRVGAAAGVDPGTNMKPVGIVDDASSATPIVLPDGTIAYGSLSFYNNDRGHLFHVSSAGVLGTYDFGWDITPAFYSHDGTYSLITKDNHYFFWDGSPSTYYITQLDASLHPEWSFQNTNPNACTRQPDGGVTCVPNVPNDGFEWCISAPAVDGAGKILGNSEDGNLYILGSDGGLSSQTFLQLALGAAYTPVAMDSQGRIYALNGGYLTVLGQ
jgi:hypothetical protein